MDLRRVISASVTLMLGIMSVMVYRHFQKWECPAPTLTLDSTEVDVCIIPATSSMYLVFDRPTIAAEFGRALQEVEGIDLENSKVSRDGTTYRLMYYMSETSAVDFLVNVISAIDDPYVFGIKTVEPVIVRLAPEVESRSLVRLVETNEAFDVELSRPLAEGERLWFHSSDPSRVLVLPEDRLMASSSGVWGGGPLRGGQIYALWPGSAEICVSVIGRQILHEDCITVEVKPKDTPSSLVISS